MVLELNLYLYPLNHSAKIMRKAIIGISIFVVFIYLLLWIAPYFVKEHFNKNSEDYIGRQASLEKLSFNPFTFTLQASNFKVWETDKQSEFMGFRKLIVNLNLLKRLGGIYQVEEISLDSPFVNIISYGDGFNFDDLLSSDTVETDEDESSDPIAFELLNIVLKKGEITYYDQARENKVQMDDLAFSLPHFAYNSESANMDLKLVINKTGHLSINNNFFPQENRLECNLKLAGLDLGIAKPYVADYVAFNEFTGEFGADLNINILLEDTTDILLSGGSWLTGVSLTDSSSSEYFKVDSLHTQLNKIDVFGEDYNIGRILINGMYLRYDAFDSTTSLDQALAPMYANENSADSSANDSSETASNMFYSIDTVMVVESHIQYRDFTLEENFEYHITEITALGTNIRSDSSKAIFSSNGVLNKVGTYNANLVLPPQNPLNFDVDFVVKGFQMGDISPFTLTYAGHPIFDGDLMYTGHTVVNNGILQSENKVIIYDLQVGDKAKGNFLVAIPLKFAVFLLKDKNGVVNLNMPMEGNLNDPQFKVGPLIWQVVKQNLEKAVAAPGKLLASQAGIDPKEIQYVAFNPLDTTLSESAKNTLLKLDELLGKKPGLQINFAYFQPSNVEVQAYVYQKAKEQYVSAKLKYRQEQEFRNLVNKTSDNDVHFVSYMNEKLATNSTNPDSLALALIGTEEALQAISGFENTREKVIVNFINSNTLIAPDSYKFSDREEVPKFPVENSGFVIEFGIQ